MLPTPYFGTAQVWQLALHNALQLLHVQFWYHVVPTTINAEKTP